MRYHWNTLCRQANDHTDIFINQQIECYANDTINLRPLTPNNAMLYQQNGDRIVATDSVMSLYPMYFNVRSKADMSQLNLPQGTDN